MNVRSEHKSIVLRAAVIFFTAAGVRLIHLWQVQSAPFFDMYAGDALGYDQWAREIAGGNVFGNRIFYQAPLYPYWLGGVYAVFGTSRWVVVVWQSLLTATSCVMLFDATRRLVSVRAATWAGVLLACYAPLIFFDTLIQKSSLDIFFVTMIIMLLARWQQRPRMGTAFGLGAALSLLTLCRENAIVLIFAIIAGIMLIAGRDRFDSKRHLGIFLLGIGFVLLPVAMRNRIVGGEFVLTTSQFGPNFYIGNGESATGMYQPLVYGGGNAEHERHDATRLAEQQAGRPLTPSEVSSFWFHRTLADIRSAPARWLRLMGYKGMLAVNRVEVTDTEDMYSYADWSQPLKLLIPVSHFGVLFPLAMIGVYMTWRQPAVTAVFLMLVCYTAGLCAFYVMARYRLPLVPMLLVFAGAGADMCVGEFRRISRKSAVGMVGIAVGSIVLCCWPLLSVAQMKSVTQYNMAVHFDVNGDAEQAMRFYRRTIELNPDDADARANLGDVLSRQQRYSEAATELEEAVRLAPDLPVPHYWLAKAYVQLGRADDALFHFRQTVKLAPDLADAYVSIGAILRYQRDTENAETAFRTAVQIAPGFALAHANLGSLLLEKGNLKEALVHFESALRSEPRNQVVRDALMQTRKRLEETE